MTRLSTCKAPIEESIDSPNAVLDLRVPGYAEPKDALEVAVSGVLTRLRKPGDPSPTAWVVIPRRPSTERASGSTSQTVISGRVRATRLPSLVGIQLRRAAWI